MYAQSYIFKWITCWILFFFLLVCRGHEDIYDGGIVSILTE